MNLVVRGHKVDLSKIKANVLNLSGQRDIIAQPHQVEALMDVISSKDKQYIESYLLDIHRLHLELRQQKLRIQLLVIG